MLVVVMVGSLGRSEVFRSAVVRIVRDHQMVMRRLSVVLCQVLVDVRVRHGPCGMGERCQQQNKGDPASRRSRHGQGIYPSRLHAHR